MLLYVKDPFESNCQLLINRRGKIGIRHGKIPKASTNYSQTIVDVYENLEDYNNTTKKRKVLIVFDDMIADMEANKKLSPIATE